MNHHVIPIKTYLAIFGGLIILSGLTVLVSYIHVSPFLHLVGALAIAFAKTTLIVLWFMHVRYNNRLIWMFATIGFFFVFVFMVITLGDYVAIFNSLSPSSNAVPFDTF